MPLNKKWLNFGLSSIFLIVVTYFRIVEQMILSNHKINGYQFISQKVVNIFTQNISSFKANYLSICSILTLKNFSLFYDIK